MKKRFDLVREFNVYPYEKNNRTDLCIGLYLGEDQDMFELLNIFDDLDTIHDMITSFKLFKEFVKPKKYDESPWRIFNYRNFNIYFVGPLERLSLNILCEWVIKEE